MFTMNSSRQMSNLEVLAVIEERFRQEAIKFREFYAHTDKEVCYVATVSEPSPTGNCIDYEIRLVLPTEKDLSEKLAAEKKVVNLNPSGLFLPSDLTKIYFLLRVQLESVGIPQELGEILDVTVRDGLVRAVDSSVDVPPKPQYLERLKAGDPLSKALDLVLEAYRG